MNITTIEQTIAADASGAYRLILKLSGRYFRLLETVNPVDIQLGRGGKASEKLEGVEAGAWARIPAAAEPFDTIVITAAGAEAVKFVISDGEAGYDRLFTAFAQARTLTIPGNVTVGAAEVAALAAATRSKVVFMADPSNTDNIVLGPSGLTTTNAPIRLEPGDMWIEELSASAAWFALSGTASQTLRVMTAV